MKVENLIICDDVRYEIGDKFTLVGCYNDRIKVTPAPPPAPPMQWPLNIKLGVYFRLKREKDDPLLGKFKVDVRDSEESLLSLDADLKPELEQERPIAFGFSAGVGFKRPGPIFVNVTATGQNGEAVKVNSTAFEFRLEVGQS